MLVAVSSLALCLVRGNAEANAHEQVSQALESLRQATLAGDADKLDVLLADDLTFITATGRLITKPQYLRAVRGRMLVVDLLTFEDVAIRIYGTTAVVTHVTDIKERIGGAPSGGRFRTTRVLVNDGSGWRLVAVHGAPMQTQ
jgi:ketosteroid isomerase-like protein